MSESHEQQMKRMHLEIIGRVQGVAFRAHTMRQGRALGLCGWVRNRPDGSVELVAEGESESLHQLEQWCHTGPATASVVEVKAQWLDYVGDLEPLSIRYG